jgi:hypothetical protein
MRIVDASISYADDLTREIDTALPLTIAARSLGRTIGAVINQAVTNYVIEIRTHSAPPQNVGWSKTIDNEHCWNTPQPTQSRYPGAFGSASKSPGSCWITNRPLVFFRIEMIRSIDAKVSARSVLCGGTRRNR